MSSRDHELVTKVLAAINATNNTSYHLDKVSMQAVKDIILF
jgi:hypothetical protein